MTGWWGRGRDALLIEELPMAQRLLLGQLCYRCL